LGFCGWRERVRFGRAFSLEKIRGGILSDFAVLQRFFKDAGVSYCAFVVTFVVECVADVDKNTSVFGR
jgi:hypothetical protein